MKLNIGLLGSSHGWEIILNQEGIAYEQIKSNTLSKDNYPLIIISDISSAESGILKDYMSSGGNAIMFSETYCKVFDEKCRKRKFKYIIPEQDSIYSDVGLTDFYCDLVIPDKLELLDSKLYIAAKKIGEGCILLLPFNVNNLLTYVSAIRKKFYFDRKELPSEQVSKVSKSKIRKICTRSIEYMFDKMNLPFVQKSYYPSNSNSLFLFRVDTDFCSLEDAEDLYEVCLKNEISGTWFVDIESEKRLKNIYAKMKNQEIALHCDKHFVFDDVKRNTENIDRGEVALKKAGITSNGFAAPFGDWNESLDEVLEKKKYDYSSEFSLSYDDLPFYPFVKDRFSKVLQIPIHPISLGRLRRSHFSDAEKLRYYKNVIDEKLKAGEPILIYHHPHHRQVEIFDEVFRYINELNIPKMSFAEFADWWNKREKINLDFSFEEGKLVSAVCEELYLKISYKGKTAIVKHQKEIDLQQIPMKQSNKIVSPKDEQRIRKKVWRDKLYDYESKKGRKKHENNIS